ncbi:MAG TPA: EAL domain-containing protein [Gammaproteobacteria bacterium]|nr:EAL domain-containing protein [Gammaproteobacteria bacterium]
MQEDEVQRGQSTRFQLLNYFVWISLAGIVIASTVLGILYHYSSIKNLERVGESNNVSLATVLANNIWPRHLSNEAHTGTAGSQTGLFYKSIKDDIESLTRSTSIVKIKIFGKKGDLLFSTNNSKRQGTEKKSNEYAKNALEGHVVSRMKQRKVGQARLWLLSTYVPVYQQNKKENGVVGVIEIYSDITDLYAQVISDRNLIAGITFLSLFLIYAFHFIFVRRVNNNINFHFEQKKKDEDRIRHLAYHDGLTGLPNREMFYYRLATGISQAKRKESLIAILFLDLDRFKGINDNFGHTTGDALLIEVGSKLSECIRETDIVARQGGDEFTILLDGFSHVDEVDLVCKRIIDALKNPMELNGHKIQTSVSIGVTIYPFDDQDMETLLKNADDAMYAAKETGRNKYLFFSSSLRRSNAEKAELERKLHSALENNEYILEYQPIVDLRTSSIFGVEALLRWQDPESGIIPPARFIPILEESGFMSIVGEWVLRTACMKAREWQDIGYAPMAMAVNISMVQFKQINFVETVENALLKSGLAPEYLKLEITESMLMDQSDVSIRKLDAIRDLGVFIEADDFGTGYSSLSYLKKMPVDVLKIDRSFITDVHKSSDSAAIVTAIIALAFSLKLTVIAEGVEQIEELRYLSALNCNLIQGFFFSKPVGEEALLGMLQNPTYFIDRIKMHDNHCVESAS